MNKLFLAGIIAAGLMSSCADKQPDHDSSILPSESQTQSLTKDTATSIMQATTVNSAAGVTTINTNPAAQAAQAVTMPATKTAPGMNPPHGQPGHRCEIAVGAPLNSAPTAKAAQPTVTTTSSPVISTSQPAQTVTPTATVTAPGMNPPHGQPGHDCTIAVGQPLKKN